MSPEEKAINWLIEFARILWSKSENRRPIMNKWGFEFKFPEKISLLFDQLDPVLLLKQTEDSFEVLDMAEFLMQAMNDMTDGTDEAEKALKILERKVMHLRKLCGED